jgi:chromosome segregation ATPase
MKREFLTDLGLETEQVNKIMAEHGKTVNPLKDEADKAIEDADELKGQLSDRDKQLKDLSKKAEGNEDLQKQIADLQENNKKTAKEYQDKLDKQAFDFKLNEAMAADKVKNPKAVKALLNLETIKLDGETLIGYKEQSDALKGSDSYLFGEEQPAGLKGRQAHPPGQKPPGTVTKDQFNTMGYADKVKLYNENPELYKQLSE